MENWQIGGFGLYVHWPFCEAKCPYCDFNSHVSRTVDHAAWRAALVVEIERWAERLPGRTLGSVFFGGGTPSLMEPATVEAVLDAARRVWGTSNALEVTLEANPTSVERDRFRAFAAAGVNRVSLGVQALDDAALRALGRTHDAAGALRALDTARATFERVSFDLIYARQHQDEVAWADELARALALGPDHLSLYQLTIEPGTMFHTRAAAGRLPGLPDEDRGATLYEMTQEICGAAGLPAYEVSNHAVPGRESRHNLTYWRAGDWVGIGPGAVGRFTKAGQRHEMRNVAAPAAWLAAATTGEGHAEVSAETRTEWAEEALMMGLRISEGVDIERLNRIGWAPDADRVRDVTDLGLCVVTDGRLRTTPRGRPLLNEAVRRLL
ncbi:coproporphyrinogen III oxidase [Jannaschia sp. Os4]|uniref:radical SAM family heme chaperone HemW n=1 Tax=Jannaschia sp. Os4 TaxID=2807617 RepID=UPI001939CD91|nr:radical SAM family heme chaperone HemW [Jannaschia sp. Os4]MBM2575554.1 coproporphyrinogen III oxidase [Jannaschia sp. Os4]